MSLDSSNFRVFPKFYAECIVKSHIINNNKNKQPNDNVAVSQKVRIGTLCTVKIGFQGYFFET
jgi:hypothetical protein